MNYNFDRKYKKGVRNERLDPPGEVIKNISK